MNPQTRPSLCIWPHEGKNSVCLMFSGTPCSKLIECIQREKLFKIKSPALISFLDDIEMDRERTGSTNKYRLLG